MGDEAEYLSEQGAGEEADDWCREQDEIELYEDISKKNDLYRDAKRAQVGATIRCPFCRKLFVKKSYQTTFCSNKGKNNCKDKYHNFTNDKRRERSHRFS